MAKNAMIVAAEKPLTLQKPVMIDGQKTTKVSVKKPKAGELRGLKLVDLMQMDVDAMLTLLPRITSPSLTPLQLAGDDLDPADFVALAGRVVVFLTGGRTEAAGPPN